LQRALSLRPPLPRAAPARRKSEIAQRGADIMPLFLAATSHIFTETDDSGIQRVVTKRNDPYQA
jgi:hypothetical protein